jgi:hypothetical protein
VPTRPRPIDLAKRSVARVHVKKVPASQAKPSPVPATRPAAPAAQKGEHKRAVSEGALLDPFGKDE